MSTSTSPKRVAIRDRDVSKLAGSITLVLRDGLAVLVKRDAGDTLHLSLHQHGSYVETLHRCKTAREAFTYLDGMAAALTILGRDPREHWIVTR